MRTPRFTDTELRSGYDRAPTVLVRHHQERALQQAQQEERERTEAAIRAVRNFNAQS